jgi:hypothetical protein
MGVVLGELELLTAMPELHLTPLEIVRPSLQIGRVEHSPVHLEPTQPLKRLLDRAGDLCH